MRFLLLLFVFYAVDCQAVPFWGARQSSPVNTPVMALHPGEFIWVGELEPSGPVVVVVSLPEQRAYVYRNGVRIGVASVSTGKLGHETPTGVFTILNKDVDHRSKKYNNAPMPYAERLTWDGVALHAGGLPGYPSSHGCVHLPSEFSRLLYEITHEGTTVIIAGQATAPRKVIHPQMLTPVSDRDGKTVVEHPLAKDKTYSWNPALSPSGPLTVVVSGADSRIIVIRNGTEIGRASIHIDRTGQPLGTHAYTVITGQKDGLPHWSAIRLSGAGNQGQEGGVHDDGLLGRIHMADEFVHNLFSALQPGATMLITDAPVLDHTTGPKLTVLSSGHPGK